MAAPQINTRTVINAIWNLRGVGPAGWPTRAEIAAHLRVEETLVRPLLTELKAKRLFDSRQRSRRQVWMPWEQCH